ncbi:hypothetical protein RSOLAG1IB_08924 [Rhizoctonia solani AG-1 IB]|uniref:Uncharacterized protein n=1 Tax=Thanatephorus cucumeris (strain AG1-IB / isolate 7/3/14) TaxID=1108050 RepID=A0A0B7FPP5_THACB|nr:hypothetical protein RSOLAG1IB_08924 [Rhizoctonia solani AG-1 IB]
MDNPTHADAFLNLISSCFPSSCRPNPPALPPSPRLGALLRETESDDAMSLHSTYRPHTRQKKKKAGMQLCGINLFGKPRGHIRLEDDDDTEPPLPRPRPRYDSDAAPLPDSTIQSLSARSPTTEQPTKQVSPEEELARLRAEKAARKARKRERKLKRQLALEHTAEFEGFIGSGGDGFPISPPSTTTSTPGIEDLLEGSDRASSRLVDDADPEDGEADMGAGVYTRSTRSRSESGSSATRSSRAREEGLGVNALGLGLRGPPSPLAQVPIPEESDSVIKYRAEPEFAKPELANSQAEAEILEPQTESASGKAKVETNPPIQAHPEPEPEQLKTSITRQRPRIRISDLPLSSPGAGPGPRTLENSPRMQSLQDSSAQDGYGFPSGSPHLAIPSPRHTNLPTPRLGMPSPSTGFPSSGLSRKGFPSPGLGKSLTEYDGLGLNSRSARGSGGGLAFGDRGESGSVVGGNRHEHVFESGGSGGNGNGGDGGRSRDAGLEGRRGSGDGSQADGHVPSDHSDGSGSGNGNGSAQGYRWKGDAGRVTAGMGVALANRGE